MGVNYGPVINNLDKDLPNIEQLAKSGKDGDLIRAQIAMMRYAFKLTAITNIIKTEGDARKSVAENYRV